MKITREQKPGMDHPSYFIYGNDGKPIFDIQRGRYLTTKDFKILINEEENKLVGICGTGEVANDGGNGEPVFVCVLVKEEGFENSRIPKFKVGPDGDVISVRLTNAKVKFVKREMEDVSKR